MNAQDYDFLVSLFGSELLGLSEKLGPSVIDEYWSGNVQVPSAIESDIAAYLTLSQSEALIRAGIWVAKNYVLSGYKPKIHLCLVRWLFEHGFLERSSLLALLALESLGGQLDGAGKELALISREMIEEGRVAEGEEIIVPMLLAYKPAT